MERWYSKNMENEQNIPTIYEADPVHVANAMLRGGGFMSALATALIKGDLENQRKILQGWEPQITKEWVAQYPEITTYGSFQGNF